MIINPNQINNTILNPVLRHNSDHSLMKEFIDEENKSLIPKLMMDKNSNLYITSSKCN